MDTLKKAVRPCSPATFGAPLIEVFSVTIDNDDDNRTCKLYGYIEITDCEGAIFDLFYRKHDDPQFVSMGTHLPLTFSLDRAICAWGVVTVNVYLMDKTRNMVIAKGRWKWDYAVKNDYDQIIREPFYGSDGFCVEFDYITYRCAVIAKPRVFLVKKTCDENSLDHAELTGSIVVSSRQAYTPKSRVRRKGPSVRIVDFRPFARKVEYGTCFPVSRDVVVVPAYSNLVIEATLRDRNNNSLLDEEMEITASSSGRSRETRDGIEVKIKWDHPYMQPPIRNRRVQETELLEPIYSKPIREKLTEASVVEIFSVFVGDRVSELCGIISVNDYYHDHKPVLVYHREEQSPEELSQDGKIAFIGIGNTYRVIRGDHFCIKLDLKDGEGNQVCDADVFWGDDSHGLYWFGERMCAVARGLYGYATMHYTVFPAGFPACVSVKLCRRKSHSDDDAGGASFNISGKIVSEYDGYYECLTQYDKDHYRSRLFVRPATNPLKCQAGSNLPLLKNRLPVPKNSSLIIEVDLHVEVCGRSIDVCEVIHGVKKFKVDADKKVFKKFKGQCFDIKVSVNCGKVFNYVNYW